MKIKKDKNSWRVERVGRFEYDIHTEKDTEVLTDVFGVTNAYLISSAPGMLSILKKIEPIFRQLILDDHLKDPELRKSILVESEDHMKKLRSEIGHFILRAEGTTYRDCIDCGVEVVPSEKQREAADEGHFPVRCGSCDWDEYEGKQSSDERS